ncbi:hypothetical protein BTW08_05390 [Salinicola sp. MH3R3-1]|nr:hypothetical protein BTW08_05390 [Salinicola sp. MH3R3-1]
MDDGIAILDSITTTPELKREEQERAFWEGHDTKDYGEWRQAHRATLIHLEPSDLRLKSRHLKR